MRTLDCKSGYGNHSPTNICLCSVQLIITKCWVLHCILPEDSAEGRLGGQLGGVVGLAVGGAELEGGVLG